MEENKKVETKPEQSVSGTNPQEKQYSASEYATAIKELKQNTVSKDEYNALKAEKSELIKALAEGKAYEVDTSTPENVKSSNEIGKEIASGKDRLNYDYVKKALNYREQCLKEGKHDPFAPYSSQRATKQEEYDTAERVANILQDCIDSCNGDPKLFNGELERHMRH